MASLTRWIETTLYLRVNPRKSAVDRLWQCTFLGFTLSRRDKTLKVASKALDKLKDRVRQLSPRTRGHKVEKIVQELRTTLQGWKAYFGITEVRRLLADLDKWICRRLRCYPWKQWGSRVYREMRQRGVSVREAWNTSKIRSILMLVALLSAITTVVAQATQARFIPLIDTFVEPVLVGVKLAFTKNYRHGKINISQYQYIQRLESSSLREPIYKLLARALSEDEMLDAQSFYESNVGRKYARYGVLQIYSSVAEENPESDPVFTKDDERLLKEFADRPAGRKIILEQILERTGLRQALAPTVNAHVRECMSIK